MCTKSPMLDGERLTASGWRRYARYGMLLASLALLLGIGVAGALRDSSIIPFLTRDLAAVASVSPATGALSSLGAFLWFGTAAILLFTADQMWRKGDVISTRFLISSGVLSLYLWLDDFFMLHENADHFLPNVIGPEFHQLLELAVITGLAMMLCAHILFFRSLILNLPHRMFLLSAACLALSAAGDQLVDLFNLSSGNWQFFVEDGLKWIGIVCWFLFHVKTCRLLLSNISSPAILHTQEIWTGDTVQPVQSSPISS